ncbi:MAG TPA: hypothetical protein PLD54_03400 [Candidatus Levybacteria bacterium]|nr:hypothetical protein [Candidatus Levybacteria bacterium]
MAKAKYKEYIQMMNEQYKEVLEEFKEVHDQYVMQPEKWQDEFNTKGEKIREIMRDFELRLCANSEGGQYGKYASKLADKYWDEIRKTFPKIDFVGTKIR